MDLKTYQAPSMSEALARVKSDLGKDAVILSTRTMSPSLVEITVTLDSRMMAAEPAPIPHSEFRIPHSSNPPSEIRNPKSTDPSSMHQEIAELRSMVQSLLDQQREPQPTIPAELVGHYTRLISQNVADEIVRELLASLRASVPSCLRASDVDAQLVRLISAMVPPVAPIRLVQEDRPTVVALVGPTGVGKTTTIAKLAANLKLHAARSVGLITLDTLRLGAVEQLKLYAELLAVPFLAVTTSDEMQTAVQRMHELDVILIDTAGRNPRDEGRIAELARSLAAAHPDEVHLVLSCAAHPESIREAAEKFAPTAVTHVIFSKLDEAIGVGVLLSAVRGMKLQLSYLTNGQSIPDDIQPGCAERVAKMILG